jgi:hypothetical protein
MTGEALPAESALQHADIVRASYLAAKRLEQSAPREGAPRRTGERFLRQSPARLSGTRLHASPPGDGVRLIVLVAGRRLHRHV